MSLFGRSYILLNKISFLGIGLSEIRYYKGVHQVRILTRSEGYLIVEALEDFVDQINAKRVYVKTGDRRIVPSETVYEDKKLPPIIKEHTYELKMEKKLKELISSEESKEAEKEREKE